MRVGELSLILLLLGLPAHAGAQADRLHPMMPARSVGMGFAGRSFAAGGNALYLNPAALSLTKQYVVGFGYGMAQQPDKKGGSDFKHALNVEWTDSLPNKFHMAVGVGFNQVFSEHDDTTNVHGAVTYALEGETMGLHLGVGGHWTKDFAGTKGDENLFTGDIGMALSVKNQIMVGVAGYNLMRSHRDPAAPRGVGAGVSFWADALMLGFDITSKFETKTRAGDPKDALVSYIGMIQYMLAQWSFIRGAFRFDGQEVTPTGHPAEKSFAVGLALLAADFVGVEFGFAQNIDAWSDRTLGVTIEFYNPFGK